MTKRNAHQHNVTAIAVRGDVRPMSIIAQRSRNQGSGALSISTSWFMGYPEHRHTHSEGQHF